jgi:Peptidase A4 family
MKNSVCSVCSVVSLLLLAAPLAGIAQQLKPNEIRTNIPGATTTLAPPKDFNPLTASDEDLDYHGFPPRPDEIAAPKAFASWKSAILASKTRLVPKLEMTSLFHGPAKGSASTLKGISNTLEFYNWSGYVNTNGVKSYGSSSFYFLYSDFVVPVARQAFGVCTGGWDYESSWVGIDGYGSPDVLQAGIEADAYCSGSTTATYYSPWFEWFPNAETRITNLAIAPGDDYFVEVWNTSATAGHAYLVNKNANTAVIINFNAPAGTKLVGNTAEWVVERPTVGGTFANLTNYIDDPFWDSFAETFNGAVVDVSSPSSIPVVMVDNSLNPISYPTLLGPSAFLMQDEGSAY